MIKGIGASNGVSVAKVFKLVHQEVEIKKETGLNPEEEIKKVQDAIATAVEQIKVVKENALKNLSEEEGAVFDAHILMVQDPMLLDSTKGLINADGANAIWAFNEAAQQQINILAAMEDAYMKERAADVKDVSKRVINILAGVDVPDLTAINEEVIIVAYDLTPSETAQLNKNFVKGFATDIGGRTSHSAIMARSLEIPAVLGLNNITEQVNSGDVLAIDGSTGDLIINPSEEEKAEFSTRAERAAAEREEQLKFIGKESKTSDGHEVELAANIGSPNDVDGVLENDGEGIGLFRSEFLYMDAKDWPTEEEQFQAYKTVLERMNGKRVIVRTLDIGGDKTLDYYTFPEEMNPFLGYRAIRFCLDNVDIFKTQLRALVRASEFGRLAIMFPMIATVGEFLKAKEIYTEVYNEVKATNPNISDSIELGMMVEIPAAAAIAEQFAEHVDFMSIGTNDLMQYTMASDRMNDKVTYLYQPLNPAILKMIDMTIKGAHAKGKWVGMCGEMAGDERVIPLLLGMGLDEFSMSATSILAARKQIAGLSKTDMEALAEKALKASTQEEVQELLK